MFYFLTRKKSEEIRINRDYTEIFPPLQAHAALQSSGAVFKVLAWYFVSSSHETFSPLWSQRGDAEDISCHSLSSGCPLSPNQGKEWFKLVLK